MNNVAKNASWIIGCKIVKALLTFVITMITARFLGTSNYGLMNYAMGVVTFASPIMKLGLDAIAVHEFVNHPQKEGETLGTMMLLCIASSILCIIGILGFTCVVNSKEPLTIAVCVIYGIVLIFQAMEMMQYWFQAKLLSKYSAVAMLISYIAVSAVQSTLIFLKADIKLFALSYSVDYSIIAMMLFLFYRKKGTQKLSFSVQRAKEMMKLSRFYIISGLMIVIFNNTDRIMIKLMISNEANGLYSAAHASASMTSFVFVAIIDSMRGTIFESKKLDEKGFNKNLINLYSIITYFSLIQCLLVTVAAPFIIRIIYGADYVDSTNVLRIAIWFSTFSYIGTVRDIWILSNGYQKYLWKINLSGAGMNVLLNFLLIPIWGPSGAAIASVFSQFFTNVITGVLIKEIRPNNKLMLRGLNPKALNEAIHTLLRK